MSKPSPLVDFRLALTVSYNPNDTDPAALQSNLAGLVDYAVETGQLTGDTAAEVEDYKCQVERADALRELDPSDVEAFLSDQVESGALSIESLISTMVRFGFEDPAKFAGEMAERMGFGRE